MSVSEKSWAETKEKFINPYNFVSLGTDVERNVPEKGNLTGKISCTLTVKTPLAIPDDETKTPDPEIPEHMHYRFYRVNGQPVISGSQLKGMVRTYYEALSNSCLSVNNNNIMSARHSFPRHEGLVRFDNNGWHLFPARKKQDKGYAISKDEFRRVWYDKDGRHTKSFVFSVAGDEIKCNNLDTAVDDYNENIRIYEEMQKSYFKKYKAHLTYKIRRDPSSSEMYPVFYEIIGNEDDKKIVYLSPSQMGRSVFMNKIDDILDTHKSCSKTDGSCLCKSCALFGIISVQKGGQSRASRLRFSDAKAINGTFTSSENITLKELSSPKTTSVEFYTRRPENAVAWTYESKTTGYIKRKTGTRSITVPERSLCDVELNGRKFYLHNPKLNTDDFQTDEKTKRNNSMELCNPDTQFSFDVYFENITESQLKELTWTLTLGENSTDSNRMFKIGHGKPLGLGSVKVTVDSIESRKFDTEKLMYLIENIYPSDLISENPFDSDAGYYKELMTIVNFSTVENYLNKGTVISYPVADTGQDNINSKAHHQWFIANRSSGKNGTSTAWSIKYTLPKITDDDLSLPSYKKTGEKKSENYRQKNKRNNKEQEVYSYGEDKARTGGFFSNIKTKEKHR